jgi:hypothetical protein
MAQGAGEARNRNDRCLSGVSNCAMGQAVDGISARQRRRVGRYFPGR